MAAISMATCHLTQKVTMFFFYLFCILFKVAILPNYLWVQLCFWGSVASNIFMKQWTLVYLSIHSLLMTWRSYNQVFWGESYFYFIFFYLLMIPCIWNMEPPIKFKLCKQHKYDKLSKNYVSFWRLLLLFSSYINFCQIEVALYKHFE